jgi:hypothetical protein
MWWQWCYKPPTSAVEKAASRKTHTHTKKNKASKTAKCKKNNDINDGDDGDKETKGREEEQRPC